MRVGITGHQRLPKPANWSWVRSKIDMTLARASSPLVGISSLAVGADQVLAECVLERGGTLEAIIPFPGYEERLPLGRARELYRALLAQAVETTVLDRIGTDEECYYAAGKHVVDSCEVLLAVWDGRLARGLGGTADIVRYARRGGKAIVQINPISLSLSFASQQQESQG